MKLFVILNKLKRNNFYILKKYILDISIIAILFAIIVMIFKLFDIFLKSI
jgi:hypothetical protein